MSKPNWKDAPDWAIYLVQDGDLSWWWFENKPVYEEAFSVWDNVVEDTDGRHEEASRPDTPDTSDTLEKRPYKKYRGADLVAVPAACVRSRTVL